MPHRAKEEERIEKVIRGLLKLPDNRRCINCNSLGPQYVCTTFWTFVCTSCSGVHREFTHRVKSVSMAKFSAEEVSSLQAAGNERAKQIYFRTWDPHRNSFPDPGNLHRLREFIKHVYVDRKFSGGRDSDQLAMVKVDTKDGFSGRRSFDKYRARDEIIERRSFEKLNTSGKMELRDFIEDRRSPRYVERERSSRRTRPTAHFEVVDDRFRDDGPGSGRQRRFSNAELRAGSLSSDSQKSQERSGGPPGLRPLKEILGDSFPSLNVRDNPKGNDVRDSNGAAHAEKTAPSSIPGSSDGKAAVGQKPVSLSSLIDFGTEPENSNALEQPQNQLVVSSGDVGNSSVQSSTPEKASPPNANSVDTLLFELTSPAAAPVSSMPEPSAASAWPITLVGSGNSVNSSEAAATAENALALVPSNNGDEVQTATDGPQVLTLHPDQPSASLTGDSNSTAQPSSSSIGAPNFHLSWPSPVPNAQTPFSNASLQQSSQAVSTPVQETSSEGGPRAAGRKEIPADIFALSYSSYAAPFPNGQYHPTPGIGYGMQYHHSVAAQQTGFPTAARSTNPFDIGDDTPQLPAPTFPSMMSMQGAFPHVSPGRIGLQPQSSPYAIPQPPFQSLSYGMNVPPAAYMGQQVPNNMLGSRPQGNSISGNGGTAAFASFQQLANPQGNSSYGSGGETAFASLNPLQMSRARSQAPGTPPSYSSTGGNPFG